MSRSEDSREALVASAPAVRRDPDRFLVEPRGFRHWLASIPVGILYVIYMLYLALTENLAPPSFGNHQHTPTYHLCYLASFWYFCLLAIFLAELLFRLLLLVEELAHVYTRYKGNHANVLRRTFLGQREGEPRGVNCERTVSWGMVMGILLVPLVVVGIYLVSIETGREALSDCWDQVHVFVITTLIYNSIILAALKLRGPSAVERSTLMEKGYTNVAHGLAWGYYAGFLKVILSHKDSDDQEDIITKMKEAVSKLRDAGGQEVKRQLQYAKIIDKIVVLLPESCQIPNENRLGSTENLSNQPVEVVCHYVGKAEIRRTHGCNIDRPYDQSIYVVDKHGQEQEEKYCCMICYATPLSSLHEMTEGQEGRLTRADKLEQMRLFYTSLRAILLDSNTPNSVSNHITLLPFEDRSDDGEDVHPAAEIWKVLNFEDRQRQAAPM